MLQAMQKGSGGGEKIVSQPLSRLCILSPAVALKPFCRVSVG